MSVAPEHFFSELRQRGVSFFCGVPDSLLKSFCAYVQDHCTASEHLIAANEGAAVGHAVGHHMATGNVPLVYLQNSGLGNTVNPLISAAGSSVFAVPMLLLIGWRGQPGKKDEPQHRAQGEITLQMLGTMGIPHHVLRADDADASVLVQTALQQATAQQTPVAIVVEEGAFADYSAQKPAPTGFPKREDALRAILPLIPRDGVIFATTGKLSRELFELRYPEFGEGLRDVMTVGSMGHCHAIALGAALAKPSVPVFCLDGDGSLLMHMGTLAVSASTRADNLRYVLFNNGAHESVGGQPTAGFAVNFPEVAKACGYGWAKSCDDLASLSDTFKELVATPARAFLEIKIGIGSRKDLRRPSLTPQQVKQNVMEFLHGDAHGG